MPRLARGRKVPRLAALSGAVLASAALPALGAGQSVEILRPDLSKPITTEVPVFTVSMPVRTSAAFASMQFLSARVDGNLLVECRTLLKFWDGTEKVSGRAYVAQEGEEPQVAVALGPNRQVAPIPVPTDITGSCGVSPATFQAGPLPRLGRLSPGPHTLELGLHDSRGALVASTTVQFTYQPTSWSRSPVIYENAVHRAEILAGDAQQSGIGAPSGGSALEQFPGLPPVPSSARVGRVSGKNMVPMTARSMAKYLEGALNKQCDLKRMTRDKDPYCLGTPLVAVDEITPQFNDWTAAERRASGKDGPGARLSQAMTLLRSMKAPWGGTYADGVQLYVAGVVLSGVAGTGTSTYRSLAGAFRNAGSVWLQMYTGSAGRGARSFSGAQWTSIPAATRRLAGSAANLRFLMTSASGMQTRAGCSSQMSCQWAWAKANATNRAILANQPGTYRVGDQAIDWLANYNATFPR